MSNIADPSSSTSKGIPPSTRHYASYLTPSSVAILSDRQREKAPGRQALTEPKVEQRRAKACGLIEAVASRMGFPRRTIATAQLLFHRFHLSHAPADFAYHEVALSALLLSSKMNDTPKRTRDILLSSYALRFPELIKLPEFKSLMPSDGSNNGSKQDAGESSLASTSSNPMDSSGGNNESNPTAIANSGLMSGYIQNANTLASVPEESVNKKAFEVERKRLLSLERLHLECSCFNFQLRAQQILALVIKISRKWKLSRGLAQSAWRVAADSHRTLAPLQYPPAALALASIYLAALLRSPKSSAGRSPVMPDALDETDAELARQRASADFVILVMSGEGEVKAYQEDLEATDGWEEDLKAHIEDIEEVVHILLDLLVNSCQSLPSVNPGGISLSASPSSPAEPSDPGLDQIGSQNPNSNKKLPPHAFSPPPLSLLDWINEKWVKSLQSSKGSSNSGNQLSLRDLGQELAHLLTESKIWLRGIEDLRNQKDAEILSQGSQKEKAQNNSAAEKRKGEDEISEESQKKKRNAMRRRDIHLVRMSWKEIGDVNSQVNGNDLDDLAARENKMLHQPKTTRFLF